MRSKEASHTFNWFEQVWNKNRSEAINELANEDVIVHGLTPEGVSKGTAEFKKYYDGLNAQFSNVHVDVEDVISEDDMESALCTVTGTHIATGKKVEFPGICIARYENGKIAEAWNCFDFLKMQMQLGFALVQQQ